MKSYLSSFKIFILSEICYSANDLTSKAGLSISLEQGNGSVLRETHYITYQKTTFTLMEGEVSVLKAEPPEISDLSPRKV